MLIGNATSMGRNPCRLLYMNTYRIVDHANWSRPSARRNMFISEMNISKTAGLPNGYEPPYCYILPQTGGGLNAYNTINGSGSIVSDMTMARSLEAALSGIGTISLAQLGIIVELSCALSGIGTISQATLQCIVDLQAAISGNGNISNAALQLIISISSTLQGNGGLSADLTGLCEMAAQLIVTGSGLNTANVGKAVWDALATLNDNPGTMGELLNNSGAGGNPWTVQLEGSYTAADLMKLMSAILAGKTSGHPNNPVFRDVNDTVNRATTTLDNDGNRTSVTLNP